MELNVAYSSSDAYAKCTGISILSLLHNNQDIEKINIVLFTTDMSDQNKNSLREIVETYNRKFTFININQEIKHLAKKFNLDSLRGAYNTYVRLFCSVWLESLERILFVDSDTLVVGPITEFYYEIMEDKIIAAVPDAGVYGRRSSVEDLEIVNKCKKYINAGVMLINLKKWRDENITQFIAEKIQEYKKDWLNQEQTIFNYALHDRCKYVHLRYNYYTTFHYDNYDTVNRHFDLGRVIAREEYEEAKKAPVIIHFVGLPYDRPWYEKSISPFKDIYMEYYNKSPWKLLPLEKFPTNPQLGYRVYDYLLFITRKHKLDKLHNLIKAIFGEKLKKYLRLIAGKRK